MTDVVRCTADARNTGHRVAGAVALVLAGVAGGWLASQAQVAGKPDVKLLLENDHVRVLQYTLLPGALDHWHTHPPRVGYVLSGAKIRVTEAAGSHQDYDEKTGDTYWGDFSPLHDTLNMDTKPYIALLVEVKASATSATADAVAIQAALAAATQMPAPK